MTGVAEQAALAIDNAQWFSRLRILGAEEERVRIARDLHDRVAQSLAYLAFELDRISSLSLVAPVTVELEALRHDVRVVVTEVRDTLYDLRTDVSESQDMMETLSTFLERVRSRSGLAVSLAQHGHSRLPLPIEREFWRIAQEAATNVERHARATTLDVVWHTGTDYAEIGVTDDGRGFPVGDSTRFGSYGLLGMRERADAIGATLEIESTPGKGTSVRCRLTMA
jgi:signal transduction histidine kinase